MKTANTTIVFRGIVILAGLIQSGGSLAFAADAVSDAKREQAGQILSAAGVQGGLVVHLGCGDGRLTAALRAGGNYLVDGLDADPANVQSARCYFRALGMYGGVWAESWTGSRLPYADNLVNLLVAEDLGTVPLEDVMRVLVPGGVAYLKKAGQGTKAVLIKKPRPANIDEWTHYLHDASNNAVAHDTAVGPPRHLQWTAGPAWVRHHDHVAGVHAMVSCGGRLFHIVDEASTVSILLPPKWTLVARDAFNGAVLWKRPIPDWMMPLWPLKSGPAQLPRRLVAEGDRVFITLGLDAPLSMLDAATGRTLRTYPESKGTEEVICSAGMLYVVAGDDPKPWRRYRLQSVESPKEKTRVAAVCLCDRAQADEVPRTAVIHDAQGRQIIPGGFVTLTHDRIGTIHYEPDDYRRIVRMGANFQVIRIALGRLGGWPGVEEDPAYLGQIDNMVQMGREAGLKTIFKMGVFGLGRFGEARWDALYNNTNGAQDALLAAWKKIWVLYQDESSVFGYDLLNEPHRGLDKDEARCTRELLLPLLRRLADAMHEISPGKWALYQPMVKAQETIIPGQGSVEPINEPFGRDRVIYAPHTYQMSPRVLNLLLDRFEHEAALSGAPLMLGEWGPQTKLKADDDPQLQAQYTEIYQVTASELDKRGIGGIKAWFCGSRSPKTNASRPEPFTWAIFSDTDPVGHVERKFITDVIVRPRPLVVAGHLEHFEFDFATRTLTMRLQPDGTLGSSEIFVPLERHYPEGLHIEIGSGLTLALPSDATHLRGVKAADQTNRQQAGMMRWDAGSQHLIIEKWVVTDPVLTVKIAPMP